MRTRGYVIKVDKGQEYQVRAYSKKHARLIAKGNSLIVIKIWRID